MYLRKTVELGGRELSIETGELAKQANGSVVLRYGDTMVLVTATMSRGQTDRSFLPLFVDFVAKTYAAGRIPGGYFKREGRPTEYEILNSRMIDRPIRPLFPDGCRNELQIVAMVLSTDQENDPANLGLLGASAALTLSDIPWKGPVASLRVGRLDGQFIINPATSKIAELDLDLVVAVGRDGVVMVEGEADFLSEDVIVEALVFAEKEAQPLLDIQDEIAKELGTVKTEIPLPQKDEELATAVAAKAIVPLKEALAIRVKHDRYAAVDAAKATVKEQLAETYPDREGEISGYFEDVKKHVARQGLLETGKRIDGRSEADIRDIHCKVGLLPRTHGSALFTRGETQALVTVTLGSGQDKQRIDSLAGEYFKTYMLHYNFPSFSVGEVRPNRGPSRRDIGHGNLAERGTSLVLPEHDDFPYTIRIVSEVLESNGSSSMATVCGASMALMDAGAPISGPVAGVAMGLINEGGKYFVLSDILGDEDHMGDMDFKIVGNADGVSAVQMDIKISGLPQAVMERALGQARDARLHILGEMSKAIDAPREEMSPYAPRITTLQINPEKIGALIGPGGKHIRGIIDETGASIDVNDDGKVNVAAVEASAMELAIKLIEGYTAEAEVGKSYMGKVVKIADFGAFIEILPGMDGLCHISELSDRRVAQVTDVLTEGDEVLVKVIAVDSKSGKIKLSRREAMKR
jgi:polyribonucleotide nucleotidyltransferase